MRQPVAPWTAGLSEDFARGRLSRCLLTPLFSILMKPLGNPKLLVIAKSLPFGFGLCVRTDV